MPNPTVTIITPSFNQGQFIGATIDSVLSQDYPYIEYLIMDGGSTDQTRDILQSYRDDRLVWVSEADRGQSDAINKGLVRAKGSLLTYINSDDLLLPGAISFTVNYFEARPLTDALFGDCELIDENGNSAGNLWSKPFNLANAVLGMQYFVQQGTFWRRSVTDKIGLFDETLHYVMDQDYWLRMALAGLHLDYVPGNRAAFRMHGASKTVSQEMRFMEDWYAIIEKTFSGYTLPAEIANLHDSAVASIDWRSIKVDWANGQRSKVRSRLHPFLKDRKRRRQLLAASMLVDSYAHTPLTALLGYLFFKVRGEALLK